MQQVLQQLAGIPGVVGTMACGPSGELLASAFPPLFDEAALRQVAALFADETSGLRQRAGPDGSLDLRYARGRALARPFARGMVLVIGTLAVDAALVGLSLEQAVRRLDAAAGQAPAPHRPAPQPAAPAAVPAEVVTARAPLQEVLVRHIGPIGGLVFEEAWAAWAAAAPPSRARLEQLVADLSREIDEADERTRFVAEARAALG
ncbi:MAG: hypothetical protein IPO09_08410 [Anaeromyxobacter sp.]|nr:hypothetical protein [Anaeromyxobacter sp.]MBL0277735.1 hypothetical protein [Anaeromyxobacter sp.]